MSRDESGRLFSKVAKFVRNPLKDRSAPDAGDSAAPTDGHDREMLKEMVEQRQRNDVVRRREFEMLRKVRLAEAASEVDAACAPSSSSPDVSDRSGGQSLTLRKIDDVEDQMSRQWEESGALSTDVPVHADAMSARRFHAYADTQPGVLPLPSVDKSLPSQPVAALFSLSGNGWTCPPHLTREGLGELTRVLGAAGPEWELDWRALTSIDSTAVAPLNMLFVHWAGISVHLKFAGEAVLLSVLAAATPVNDRNTAVVWWELRMNVLRTMHKPDSFELAALHYCLTYEVSPTLWKEPHCRYVSFDESKD